MSRADPHRALLRALAKHYPGLRVLASRSEPWASATFTGARHILSCDGCDLAGIADVEFSLSGHLVADIGANPDNGHTTIEALTIETD